MDPIVLAAGTALVGAMATDAWQQTRIAVVSWWGRVRSDEEAEGVRGTSQRPAPRFSQREMRGMQILSGR